MRNISFISFTFLLTVNFLIPITVFSQPITFEKYYDTLGCFSGSCVQQTYDKGYIITGVNSVSSSNNNVALLKTDSIGNIKWIKSYGGINDDGGEYIQQTLDSGFIVAADKDLISTTNSKIWLLKTDKNGDTLWTKSIILGLGGNFPTCLQQTTDGGYIITGYTNAKGVGSYDVFLVKTNSVGDTTWAKTFGTTGGDVGWFVEQTTDGGYIITGEKAVASQADVYLIKTDGNGDSLWTKTYGGYRADVGYCVKQTTDGGFIVCGLTSSFKDTIFYDAYLIKTNSNGDTIWTKDYYDSLDAGAYSIEQTKDGGYMIICDGNGNSQQGAVYLMRTNSLGDTLWTRSYGEGYAIAMQGTLTLDGGCIITGQYDRYSPSNSIYLLKTDSVGFSVTGVNEISTTQSNIFIYPNPFSESAILSFSIPEDDYVEITMYNYLGEKAEKLFAGQVKGNVNQTLTISAKEFSQGIYFLTLRTSKDIKNMKCVLKK